MGNMSKADVIEAKAEEKKVKLDHRTNKVVTYTAETALIVANEKRQPKDYTKELGAEICRRITLGKSLVTICKDVEMPSRDTIYTWLDEKSPQYDATFSDKYARAKQDQGDYLADDIDRIADDTLKGTYKPYAAQVAIDAKKWSAAHLRPRKYGDKIDITSDGQKLPTPIYKGVSIGTINNPSIEVKQLHIPRHIGNSKDIPAPAEDQSCIWWNRCQ